MAHGKLTYLTSTLRRVENLLDTQILACTSTICSSVKFLKLRESLDQNISGLSEAVDAARRLHFSGWIEAGCHQIATGSPAVSVIPTEPNFEW
jgi:hypothetical protein